MAPISSRPSQTGLNTTACRATARGKVGPIRVLQAHCTRSQVGPNQQRTVGPVQSATATLAGRSDTLFSDDATTLIHQTSRGYPRAVNNIALQALVAAFANNKPIVDESSARAAVSEVTAE